MKYEGILICSDMDGTFLPTEENLKALKEFQAEGGKFTFATGRNLNYIKRYFKEICKDFKPNAPIIACNGAAIYDLENDKLLQENFIPPESLEIFSEIAKEHGITMRVSLCADTEESENVDIPNNSIDKNRIYKAVFKISETIECFDKFMIDKFSDNYEISRSCTWWFELNAKGISKSSGTLYIKEVTGSDTLVCVGDYGNDIPMLKTADISYAVGNALDNVKQAAMRVTVPCTEHAIAKIIEELA